MGFKTFADRLLMLDVVPVLLNSMKGGKLVPHNDRGALSRGHTAVVKVIFENFATAQLAALANMMPLPLGC